MKFQSIFAVRVHQFETMSLLVTLLTPILRVCRWSGLSPIDLDHGTAFSPQNTQSYVVLMVFWLTIEIGHFLHSFARHDIYVDWESSKMTCYIDIVTPLFIRLHVFVIFIESFWKRSQQIKLLDKIAEIETFFTAKFQLKIDSEKLRRIFRNHIGLWLFRITVTIGCTFLASSWARVYYLFLYIVPFYTSSLMYVQIWSHIDAIRYFIEMLNDDVGQLSMSHVPRNSLTPTENRTFVFAFDKFERLRQLRRGYRLIWQATVMVNQCTRWSLPIGINNEFVTMINDIYWIFFLLLDPTKSFHNQVLLCAIWASINFSHICQASNICDRTVAEVSLCCATNAFVISY